MNNITRLTFFLKKKFGKFLSSGKHYQDELRCKVTSGPENKQNITRMKDEIRFRQKVRQTKFTRMDFEENEKNRP